MTTNIQNSLYGLIDALSELEKASVSICENAKKADSKKIPKTKGADLFSFPENKKEENSQALASRLDGAIAKVEKLLQEA
ncbi:MAG: hypothetical protein MRY79_07010 [Alphaproteobacteria bacterium]|nr:hypothetical protein [Alphaproteobacteria bacterium]